MRKRGAGLKCRAERHDPKRFGGWAPGHVARREARGVAYAAPERDDALRRVAASSRRERRKRGAVARPRPRDTRRTPTEWLTRGHGRGRKPSEPTRALGELRRNATRRRICIRREVAVRANRPRWNGSTVPPARGRISTQQVKSTARLTKQLNN